MATRRTVRVLDTTGNKRLRTVNISLTDNANYEKVTASPDDSRVYETVQNSGGAYHNLPTLYVANPDVVESNILLEDGTNLLLEDGSVILTET